MTSSGAGKGDRNRTTNLERYGANWDRIYGKGAGNGKETKAKKQGQSKKAVNNRSTRRTAKGSRTFAVHTTDRTTPAYAQAEAREARGLKQYKYD